MTQPSRRKRSSHLALTSLMAGTAVSISACDDAPRVAQWDNPPAVESSAPVDAKTFNSVAECEASGMEAATCQTAYAQAQASEDTPKYSDRQSCEERFGVDQCVPRSSSNGGSFFTPLLTGFIVGQMLNGGGGYRGAPMFRDREGGYFGGGGYPISRDYVTGRTQVGSEAFMPARAAPARVQSRSSVISRSGFGGGSRSFGG